MREKEIFTKIKKDKETALTSRLNYTRRMREFGNGR